MKFEWGIVGRLAAVVVAAALVSCATADRDQQDGGLTRAKASTVFGSGFENIAQKYLEDVDIGTLALEGVKGLGAIDPAVVTRAEGGKLTVLRDDRKLAQLAMPGSRDVGGWANLVAEAAVAGSQHSGEIREAGTESVYEAVFDGMLARLDTFSRYAGRRTAERNRAKRTGFDGIGITFRAVPKGALIVAVAADTPASRAGILKDDIIVSIDGQGIAEIDVEAIKDRLRGPLQSFVELGVEREASSSSMSFRVERQLIIDPTVFTEVKDGVLYLTVTGFNTGTVRSVREAVYEARSRASDIAGIVIDLRSNSGGLLKQAVQVADLFLAGGLIVTTAGRHPESFQRYEADERDIAAGLPIVVLVDGRTASAAEIVASALQDEGRAVLVGTTSYGKGSVQTVIRLPNDGEMTLTWSRFVTPAGYILHRLGVHPSVCTSGIPADDPLPPLDASGVTAREAATLRAWQEVRAEDTAGRSALRSTCPAEQRVGSLELRLARRLIENPPLYRRYLLRPEGQPTATLAEALPIKEETFPGTSSP
jgi:carboxyl-terminal processing protease